MGEGGVIMSLPDLPRLLLDNILPNMVSTYPWIAPPIWTAPPSLDSTSFPGQHSSLDTYPIRSPSPRYASYWNAFLFIVVSFTSHSDKRCTELSLFHTLASVSSDYTTARNGAVVTCTVVDSMSLADTVPSESAAA